MKVKVLIDDEETGLIEGSVIHVDEVYDNGYEGSHSSMAGTYTYMVKKGICVVLPDNWDDMDFFEQIIWINEHKRDLKIDNILKEK